MRTSQFGTIPRPGCVLGTLIFVPPRTGTPSFSGERNFPLLTVLYELKSVAENCNFFGTIEAKCKIAAVVTSPENKQRKYVISFRQLYFGTISLKSCLLCNGCGTNLLFFFKKEIGKKIVAFFHELT